MLIELDVRDHIGYLTLNRPDALNAINRALMDDLDAALNAVATDARIRVVILSGRGRAFCAGSDIKDLAGVSSADAERIVRREAELCQRFEELPQPTIAAVEGYALGGGAALLLYQNIRIASETAVFGLPEVTLGWNPAFGMARLTRLIGRGWASDLMLTGRTIAAHEALAIGLVDRVVPAASLMETAETLAKQIADNPIEGVRAIKAILRAEEEMPLAKTDDYELRVFEQCARTDDAQAQIRAFVRRSHRRKAR